MLGTQNAEPSPHRASTPEDPAWSQAEQWCRQPWRLRESQASPIPHFLVTYSSSQVEDFYLILTVLSIHTCEMGTFTLLTIEIGNKTAMAAHSSTLAWKIPWTEEPGRLQSMGSLRVGHDWATSLSLFTFMHWRRKWQPTPVFLPGESQGWGSLVGCHLWGRTESDTTEVI